MRQEDRMLQASLGYIMRPCFKECLPGCTGILVNSEWNMKTDWMGRSLLFCLQWWFSASSTSSPGRPAFDFLQALTTSAWSCCQALSLPHHIRFLSLKRCPGHYSSCQFCWLCEISPVPLHASELPFSWRLPSRIGVVTGLIKLKYRKPS